jgi:hypothetical protein
VGRYNHLPIFQAGYKLNLDIYRATEQFSRECKYTLGQKMKELVLEFLIDIVAANQKKDKRKALADAKIILEQIRICVRLAFDLKILGLRRYEYLSRAIEEVSKQLAGWQAWAVRSFQDA